MHFSIGIFIKKDYSICMEKKSMKKLIRFLPLACIAIGICAFLLADGSFTPENIVSLIPADPLVAMVILWLLYAGKSLTVVFPVMVLQAVAGYLFDPFVAIMVNVVGMLICFLIPYCVGRASGEEILASLEQKYPKMQVLHKLEDKNALFVSFFLRIISILPLDVVSMYLGAERMPILPFLIGSMAGTFPAMLSVLFLGAGASNGSVQMLAGALAVIIALPVISYTVYKIWQRRHK